MGWLFITQCEEVNSELVNLEQGVEFRDFFYKVSKATTVSDITKLVDECHRQLKFLPKVIETDASTFVTNTIPKKITKTKISPNPAVAGEEEQHQ